MAGTSAFNQPASQDSMISHHWMAAADSWVWIQSEKIHLTDPSRDLDPQAVGRSGGFGGVRKSS